MENMNEIVGANVRPEDLQALSKAVKGENEMLRNRVEIVEEVDDRENRESASRFTLPASITSGVIKLSSPETAAPSSSALKDVTPQGTNDTPKNESQSQSDTSQESKVTLSGQDKDPAQNRQALGSNSKPSSAKQSKKKKTKGELLNELLPNLYNASKEQIQRALTALNDSTASTSSSSKSASKK
jgi:hypothetical protein